MPQQKLRIKPGVDVESTDLAGAGGWTASSLIRFRSGWAEAIRGWAKLVDTALRGVCRAIHYWVDLDDRKWYAFGTNTNLYVETAGTLSDITPTNGFTAGPASSDAGVPFSLLVWTLDNFGERLIAVPSKQGIFLWQPSSSPTPATLIPEAPDFNQGAFVIMPAQIVMAYGSSPDAGVLDPMLIRWSDQSDYTSWTPSTTNQAGSFRLPRGSRIIGAIQAPGMAFIWTDIDVWTVQYIGFPLVFSFFQAGSQCGLISQHSMTVMGGVIYWMTENGFFQMAGSGPVQIPCSVWDVVYRNLNLANQDKCLAGAEYKFSEVWFFFPSNDSGAHEIDSYVKYNLAENLWDYGPATVGVSANQMARTGWVDQNVGVAITVDLAGFIQEQDTNWTAAGEPINGFIRSGYVDISDGGDIQSVDMFIPDFQWDGDDPEINVTLFFQNYSGEDVTSIGPFSITPGTEYVTLRLPRIVTIGSTTVTAYPAIRARQVAIHIDTVSGFWRFGAPRLRINSAGRLP